MTGELPTSTGATKRLPVIKKLGAGTIFYVDGRSLRFKEMVPALLSAASPPIAYISFNGAISGAGCKALKEMWKLAHPAPWLARSAITEDDISAVWAPWTMAWKPDVMIYHSPCDDGFGAAWAAWMRWRDAVEYVPGTYGKPAPDVSGKRVLIGDFSFKRDALAQMGDVATEIVILDHHKTAYADLAEWSGWTVYTLGAFDGPSLACAKECTEKGRPIAAAFDMDKSGARMTWEFCHPGTDVPPLIRFIEDRDLWRFAYPETKAFSLWLRSHPYDFEQWEIINQELLDARGAEKIMAEARAMQRFYDQKIAEMIRERRDEKINGIIVPTVNCSWAFASDVAHALLEADPEAPFAACYYDRGDGARSYSLRSEDHRMDVSAIAKRYGGGGHRNAAGFEVPA